MEGTLGGKFTTVEGLLTQIREQVFKDCHVDANNKVDLHLLEKCMDVPQLLMEPLEVDYMFNDRCQGLEGALGVYGYLQKQILCKMSTNMDGKMAFDEISYILIAIYCGSSNSVCLSAHLLLACVFS